MRKTRIICTIGPATGTQSMLERVIRAGMDVARLNMSHGSSRDHRGYIMAIRAASRKLDRPVGILLDLQGIKIRISDVAGEGIYLRKGREVLLRSGQRPSTTETLHISYP
ncbi:MAG: pyruvate kinase, partial [bacterium]